jgi:hypothetical protein
MAIVSYTNPGPHPRSIGGKLILPGETRDVDDVGLIPAGPSVPESAPESDPETPDDHDS